jgi:anti-sigma regulatory factor (Ser/Thr protein kinase)
MAPAAWSSSLRLAAHPVSAARARHFVRHRLEAHVPAYLASDVELVVSELVTNALLHAQPPYRMSLRAFEVTLRLEVEDGAQTGPVRVFAPSLATAGRGIALVCVLSRDWGVSRRTDGGKSVWAEFDLQ